MSNTVDMIFEAVLNGELDDSQRDRLENIIFYESFFKTISSKKIKSMMKYIKNIHDEVPNEYSDNKYVKKFIDKNYTDIMKTLKYLYDKDDIESAEAVKPAIVCCISLLAGTLSMLSMNFTIIAAGFVAFLISFVSLAIACFYSYSKYKHDIKMYKDVINIREKMKKIVSTKKLPDNYNEKFGELINKIDDIERNYKTDSNERKILAQQALVAAVATSNR